MTRGLLLGSEMLGKPLHDSSFHRSRNRDVLKRGKRQSPIMRKMNEDKMNVWNDIGHEVIIGSSRTMSTFKKELFWIFHLRTPVLTTRKGCRSITIFCALFHFLQNIQHIYIQYLPIRPSLARIETARVHLV